LQNKQLFHLNKETKKRFAKLQNCEPFHFVDKLIDKMTSAVEKDAEDVIWVSSPYKGTAETQSTAKKPH